MTQTQSLQVQEKKELTPKEEKTVPARYYVPNADIYETEDALVVVMEIPGVEKKDLNISLENDVLRIEGRIDFTKYKGLIRSTPNTMSATTHGHSPCRARSTSIRSARI